MQKIKRHIVDRAEGENFTYQHEDITMFKVQEEGREIERVQPPIIRVQGQESGHGIQELEYKEIVKYVQQHLQDLRKEDGVLECGKDGVKVHLNEKHVQEIVAERTVTPETNHGIDQDRPAAFSKHISPRRTDRDTGNTKAIDPSNFQRGNDSHGGGAIGR